MTLLPQKKRASYTRLQGDKWRPDEDAKLLRLVGTGMTWKEISGELLGRTEQGCMGRYRTLKPLFETVGPDPEPPISRTESPELSSSQPTPEANDNMEQLLADVRAKYARLKARAKIERLEKEIGILESGGESLANSREKVGKQQAPLITLPRLIPEKLLEYHGKSVREHRDWVRSAQNAFKLSPSMFVSDETKIRSCEPHTLSCPTIPRSQTE